MKKVAAAVFLGASSAANAEVLFQETFEDGEAWTERWVKSDWKSGQMGETELSAGKYFDKDNAEASKGLKTTEDHRFYALAASFGDKKGTSNKDKDLLIQYSLKYEEDIQCGGGYIKVGGSKTEEELKKFGDPTEYNIMFGPDRCGSTKRTHLIFNDKKDKAKGNVLKGSDIPYKQENVGLTSLYRMILRKDNTVEVELNGENLYTGKLADDWKLLPAKEIADPEDTKPEDWVEEAMIDDPEDKKPEDWVEEEEITDPDAKKPEDWDDEEDGEWEAPKKKNPDYKGPWSAKRIANPAYKGPWAAKKIPNPEYKEDEAKELHVYDDFGFIGIDLWQVKSGSIFDNLIVETGDIATKTEGEQASADEVEKAFPSATKLAENWKKLHAAEKELKDADSTTTTTTTAAGAESSKEDGDIDVEDDADDDKEDL